MDQEAVTGAATMIRSANTEATSRPESTQKRMNQEIYKYPLPVRTFPMPAVFPNNPLSLLHLVYVWIGQIVAPPPKEPSVMYQGVWDPATGSVHIKDPEAVRGLWEKGFFGKGSLSRSEPNWRLREFNRRGALADKVAEQLREARREERYSKKWERAKTELEALEKIRLEESTRLLQHSSKVGAGPTAVIKPPVGPLELLALPNAVNEANFSEHSRPPLSPLPQDNPLASLVSGIKGSHNAPIDTPIEGVQANGQANENSVKSLKHRKSVRFSPKVESTIFEPSDHPSPKSMQDDSLIAETPRFQKLRDVHDMEHFQISPEEAFFLVFALGILLVRDPTTHQQIPIEELFAMFRAQSHVNMTSQTVQAKVLRPDDLFLIHYAVYHHFRSLGWVVRHGIKFGADWLLYQRGPVFDHAEFALRVLPSYSDPEWQSSPHECYSLPWSVVMGTVRVLSRATKSLVIVYVDVPSPHSFERALNDTHGGIAAALALYKVSEYNLRRWSANRNR